MVLSLKLTGQHVSVPIHVQTRSLRAGESTNSGDVDHEYDESSNYTAASAEGFWVSLSWLHLLLLVLLTILLLLACEYLSHVIIISRVK